MDAAALPESMTALTSLQQLAFSAKMVPPVIPQLTSLESLRLEGAAATPGGLRPLTGLTPLMRLRLSGCGFPVRPAAALAELDGMSSRLRVLQVEGSDGLREALPLRCLIGMRALSLVGNGLIAEGLPAKFLQQLAACTALDLGGNAGLLCCDAGDALVAVCSNIAAACGKQLSKSCSNHGFSWSVWA